MCSRLATLRIYSAFILGCLRLLTAIADYVPVDVGFAEYRDMVNNALVIDSGDPATGTSSSMLLLPEHNVGLFVSFNCCSGHGMHRIQPSFTQRFLDHFYTVPPAPEDGADKMTSAGPAPPPMSSTYGGRVPAALAAPMTLARREDVEQYASETESEDDGTDEQQDRREFRRRRKLKAMHAQLAREVALLFEEHTLDLFSAFAPLDPDGDYRISRAALAQGLRRLVPTIQKKHIDYLANCFPAPDKPASDDEAGDEDDVTLRTSVKMATVEGEVQDDNNAHGTGYEEDEDEGAGAVDYRALSSTFGQSWVVSMAPRLQSAEHLAQYASFRSRRKFSARSYVGHYVSTRTPANTIDMLCFYLCIVVVEPSENAHLSLRRFHPAVSSSFSSIAPASGLVATCLLLTGVSQAC